jgi:hypothetical protein
MQGDKLQDSDGIQDDEEDELQEDEDGRYPMFQKENDSDVDDNSGVVLSNPNPCSVMRHPATPPGFNSADWNASHEFVEKVAAIIAGPPVGGMPLMAKTAIVDKNNGGGKQSAISSEKDIVVVWLNFAAKTFRVKQEGQETTCHAVLLVKHKPAVALN